MAKWHKQLVDITPDSKDLTFVGTDSEQLYETITLDNIFNTLVAYKVKITDPDKLSAEPPRGLIGVGQQITIDVTLQNGSINKLALLIETVPVPPEHSKKTIDLLFKDLKSKIRQTLMAVKRSSDAITDDAQKFYSCLSTDHEAEESSTSTSKKKPKWWQ